MAVDHDEAEPPEERSPDERVRADREAAFARRQPCAHGRLFGGGLPAQQELGAHLQRLQQAGECCGVLLGEEFGRRHQRGLEVVLHREQHREERDDRLPRADVAHQQPVHPVGRRHVAGDFPDRLLLIVRELPGQALAKTGGVLAPDLERDAAPLPLGDGTRADEHQLEIEQLVERQPAAALLRFLR